MKSQAMIVKRSTLISVLLVGAVIAFCSATNVRAEPITPDALGKADAFKKKLVEWAANPAVITAVKESNAKGGVASVSNAKWNDLADADPILKV